MGKGACYTSEGKAGTLWLSAMHRRTTVKADSKVLSGIVRRWVIKPGAIWFAWNPIEQEFLERHTSGDNGLWRCTVTPTFGTVLFFPCFRWPPHPQPTLAPSSSTLTY